MNPSVKVVGLEPDQWAGAVYLASLFYHQYKNHRGIRNGVVYSNGKDDMYVYSTETQIVVRGTREPRE